MAFRINSQNVTDFPKAKPKKNSSYLAFLHSLPCVVTGKYEVQAAHLSFANPRLGHYGRGKGRKAPDRWALPLSGEEHRRQHSMNEEAYWKSVGIRPHLLALIIFGLWADLGDDAEAFATAVINQTRSEAGRRPVNAGGSDL